jgi:uncharacterized protein
LAYIEHEITEEQAMDGRKKRVLTDEAKKKIAEILKSIILTRPELTFVYLHGSFTENGSFGDIDLAVYLASMPESPLRYELALETECMNVLQRYAVDIRVLNEAPLSFQYNVLKGGILLDVRDAERRAEFQEDVLARYFDFSFFRQRYLREAAGAEI